MSAAAKLARLELALVALERRVGIGDEFVVIKQNADGSWPAVEGNPRTVVERVNFLAPEYKDAVAKYELELQQRILGAGVAAEREAFERTRAQAPARRSAQEHLDAADARTVQRSSEAGTT